MGQLLAQGEDDGEAQAAGAGDGGAVGDDLIKLKELNQEGNVGKFKIVTEFTSVDDPDDSSPTYCGLGEWGMWDGTSEGCTACEAGKYKDVVADVDECTPCPPGTYGDTTGAYALTDQTTWDGVEIPGGCKPCPVGTFNEEEGATECLACDEDNGWFCGAMCGRRCTMRCRAYRDGCRHVLSPVELT